MKYEIMVMVKGDDRYTVVAECSDREEAEYVLATLSKRSWASPPKLERKLHALHSVDRLTRS